MVKNKKGFTLIELLVVIAIIGILSAIVLASLNSTRDKAEEIGVKANLNNVRLEAELFYDENNSYVGLCDDPRVEAAFEAAKDSGYINPAAKNDCVSDSTTWIMWVELKTSDQDGVETDEDIYCVDSTLDSRTLSWGQEPGGALGGSVLDTCIHTDSI